MNYKFQDSEYVLFDDSTVKGRGIIRGVTTMSGTPVLGHTYMIELYESNVDPSVYPFTHIPMFEVYIKSDPDGSYII